MMRPFFSKLRQKMGGGGSYSERIPECPYINLLLNKFI